MRVERFTAGGTVDSVGDGVRQLIFTRELNRPGWEIVLDNLGVSSQSGGVRNLVELIGEAIVFSETLFMQTAQSGYVLPFYRFRAQGILQMFITNGFGAASSLTGHVWGRYVRRV